MGSLRRREAMAVLIDTASVAPRDRFDFWAAQSPHVFTPIDVRRRTNGTFSGLVTGHTLGPARVYRIVADASDVFRTPTTIRASDPETLELSLQVRGSCVFEQDDRQARLVAGDLCGVQSSRPFAVRPAGPVEFVMVSLARDLFGIRERSVCGLTATRLAGDAGMAWLTGPMLAQVASGLDAGRVGRDDGGVLQGVVDLVCALFAERVGAEQRPAVALVAGIKAYIEEHLGRPGLGPEEVARANYVSVRYLHRLFERDGITVSEWIRDRRLERCRRDLRDPLLRHEPIVAIATRWGLPSPAHFSRAYRAAYGHSPREERRMAFPAAS